MAKAYITMLTNLNYLPGALVLARSLKKCGAQYPLYVMIPKDGNPALKEKLEQAGQRVLVVPKIEIAPELEQANPVAYWNDTFFKIRATTLTQFEKIAYVDADMVVLKNIDDLLEKPNLSAAAAGLAVHPSWTRLNSGLMVLEPSMAFYEKLMSLVKTATDARRAAGLGFGDQDVFNAYCPDWAERKELHLPETYNLLRGNAGTMCRKILPGGFEDIRVVHFIGAQKPWSYTWVNYLKMLYHGITQGSFGEWRAFCIYRDFLREDEN